jgi:2-isopropylmalate synthase
MSQNNTTSNNEWIYDWNVATPPHIPKGTRILLNDETLRDGLQNPSVSDPSIGEKIAILHLMESLGLDSVNIGLPGAGPRAVADVEALARGSKPTFVPSPKSPSA